MIKEGVLAIFEGDGNDPMALIRPEEEGDKNVQYNKTSRMGEII